MTQPAPFFLDCDTGIDDALALAYLLASPRADLVGIGTVSGNVSAAGGGTEYAGPAELGRPPGHSRGYRRPRSAGWHFSRRCSARPR